MKRFLYLGVIFFVFIGAGCAEVPKQIENINNVSQDGNTLTEVENKPQVNYMPDVKPIEGPDRPLTVTNTAPEDSSTTNKPSTTNVVKPTTKPSNTIKYDANGFPLNPVEMQKFTSSNGETYYYVEGVWTHEDYVYPYQNQNTNSQPDLTNANPDADPDSLNFVEPEQPSDPNACASEGATYTSGENTYYCIDGIWTHEDYAYPYQNL